MGSVAELLDQVLAWAGDRSDILGVALVGSHAAGRAREGSDVDIVLVAEDARPYLADDAWLDTFGERVSVEDEDYGLVRSRRAKYAGGLEVEWGLADRRWLCTDPLDEPTARVLTGGARVLYDPHGLIARLVAAARGSSTTSA